MSAEILTLLLRVNLAAGLAILLIVALRKPLRQGVGARLAYAAWSIAPLAMVASLLPARASAPLTPPGLPLNTAAEAAIRWVEAPQIRAPMDVSVQGWTPDIVSLLIVLWGVGVVLGLATVTFLQWRSLRMLGALHPTDDARVMQADRAAVGPAVIGLLYPRIVVPADFETRFSAQERTVVLAHERVHLAGADWLVNAVLVLCQCLNWFNPLIHLAAHLVRLDQELACDAAVMAGHPGARRAYAEAMLKTQLAPVPLPLGCYWPSRGDSPLKERLVMLKRTAPGHRRRLAGAAVIALAGAASGYAAWASSPAAETLAVQAPRLVEKSIAASVAPTNRSPVRAMSTSAAAERSAPRQALPVLPELSAADQTRLEMARALVEQTRGLVAKNIESSSTLAQQVAALTKLERSLGVQPTLADEALRLAEADVARARTLLARNVGSQISVNNAVDRLGALQMVLDGKPTAYDTALVEAQDGLDRARVLRARNVATQDAVLQAAMRLGEVQARRGVATTGYNEALIEAKAQFEALQVRRERGLASQDDVALAAQQLSRLERLAGG